MTDRPRPSGVRRLADLTPAQRRVVEALIAAKRAADAARKPAA